MCQRMLLLTATQFRPIIKNRKLTIVFVLFWNDESMIYGNNTYYIHFTQHVKIIVWFAGKKTKIWHDV